MVCMSVHVFQLFSVKGPGDSSALKRPDLLRAAMIANNSRVLPAAAIIKHSGHLE